MRWTESPSRCSCRLVPSNASSPIVPSWRPAGIREGDDALHAGQRHGVPVLAAVERDSAGRAAHPAAEPGQAAHVRGVGDVGDQASDAQILRPGARRHDAGERHHGTPGIRLGGVEHRREIVLDDERPVGVEAADDGQRDFTAAGDLTGDRQRPARPLQAAGAFDNDAGAGEKQAGLTGDRRGVCPSGAEEPQGAFAAVPERERPVAKDEPLRAVGLDLGRRRHRRRRRLETIRGQQQAHDDRANRVADAIGRGDAPIEGRDVDVDVEAMKRLVHTQA